MSKQERKKVAVFDADGTLWPGDCGEGFFLHQIKNSSAPGLKNISNPEEYYYDTEETDPHKAYSWLAQINSGLKESELQKQCADFFKNHFDSKIHPEMKKQIKEFKKSGVDIWICTASIRWAIEPALEELSIPLNHLIATSVEVKNGVLTDKVISPVPYSEGKRHWVNKLVSEKPDFVIGNSMGDFEMLKMAIEPIVIHYEPQRAALKVSEEKIMAEAKKRNWPIRVYR